MTPGASVPLAAARAHAYDHWRDTFEEACSSADAAGHGGGTGGTAGGQAEPPFFIGRMLSVEDVPQARSSDASEL